MFTVLEANCADALWREAAKAVLGNRAQAQASRAGTTRELLHAALALSNPLQRWVTSRVPAIAPAFALAEIVWILNGRNDADFVNFFNTKLPRYAGHEATYYGSYGHRLRCHFGIDQLDRACEALRANPESRQVVLQIWDAVSDLPDVDGVPRAPDIPCNVMALLKVRKGQLEWLQIMRSNDLQKGLPYNLVQFTTLQELMAGWLGLEVGPYHHVSDSLHAYASDLDSIGAQVTSEEVANTDRLRFTRLESAHWFGGLAERVDRMILPTVSVIDLEVISAWPDAPQAIQNILLVLSAEAARRRQHLELGRLLIARCTNPCFASMWSRWVERVARGTSA